MVIRAPRRDEVWLVSLDPTHGAEIQKTQPCVVISPEEMNQFLWTVIVAPMTTALRSYPTRVSVRFQSKAGQVALDQLRSVDKQRLVKKLGSIPSNVAQQCSEVLIEMFRRV